MKISLKRLNVVIWHTSDGIGNLIGHYFLFQFYFHTHYYYSVHFMAITDWIEISNCHEEEFLKFKTIKIKLDF